MVLVFLSALIAGLEVRIIDRTLGGQAHIVVRPKEESPRALEPSAGRALASRIEPSRERVQTIGNWPLIARRLRELDVVGVGFRCEARKRSIMFTLGFSHPIEYPLPEVRERMTREG